MMTEVIDYNAIANAAAEAEDQTQMKAGGSFERPIPVAGKAILRLQQYIELGVQKAKKAKFKDSEEVMLRFELHTPKHLIEIDTEEGPKKIPNTIDIRLPKGGATSKYGRLFTALNYSGKFNHFAQMVGKGSWVAEVTHNEVGEGEDKKVYANLDKNKAWTFTAPVVEDPVSGSVQPIPVPELHNDPVIFLYENKGLTDDQYLATWDTLFIEGEHEATDGKPARSKNWIQDTISTGVKFPGSRLKKLLEARGGASAEDLDNAINQIEEAAEEVKAEQPEEKSAAKSQPKQEPAKAAVDPSAGADPLLDLL